MAKSKTAARALAQPAPIPFTAAIKTRWQVEGGSIDVIFTAAAVHTHDLKSAVNALISEFDIQPSKPVEKTVSAPTEIKAESKKCPVCGGEIYDNRAPDWNGKSPLIRCKSCNWRYWAHPQTERDFQWVELWHTKYPTEKRWQV